MNLAAIAVFCFLRLSLHGHAGQAAGQAPAATSSTSSMPASQASVPTSQPQAPESQGAGPTQTSPDSGTQTANPASPAKPSPKRRHKKAVPNCSTAPTALNPGVGNVSDAANAAVALPGSTEAGSTEAGSSEAGSSGAASTGTTSTGTGSANSGSVNPGSVNLSSTNPDSAALKPCPPPRKVIRNGGSDEPTVQLTGGTTAEQAVHQRSTEQLTAATEANLKKIAGRQLNPSEQEMVSKIKQFMEQSKTAIAAGAPGRGHDLALKAHLLSDELVKP
jgi:hypothetical protein